MAEKMTLGQKLAVAKAIHDGLLRNGTVVMYSGTFQRIIADAVDAHLAQPAQAVDVGAVREVADELGKDGGRLHDEWMHKLNRAIGNAQTEG